MSDYSEEEASQYESSLNGFEHDESSQTWSDEEVVDDGTWSQEGYPNSDYEYNPGEEAREPEPPDHPSCDTISHQSWYEGETDQESHTDESHGDDSWRGDTDFQISNGEESCRKETDSEFSQEEGENRPWCEIPYSDHEEEVASEAEYKEEVEYEPTEPEFDENYEDANHERGESSPEGDYEPDYEAEETNSHISLENSEASFGEEPEYQENFAEEEEVISEAGRDDYDHRYINFSGHHQGPEAYLRWERDMEEWFEANHIQEEEQTVVAEETLTDEAFLHWDKDAYERLDYELPGHTWDEMKQLLHQEFVEKTTTEPYYPRPAVPSELRRWITATPTKKVSNPKARKQTSTNLKEKPPKENVYQKQNPQEEINVSSTIQQQPAVLESNQRPTSEV